MRCWCRLRPYSRRHRPLPLRVRAGLHACSLCDFGSRRRAAGLPIPLAIVGALLRGGGPWRRHRTFRLSAAGAAHPGPLSLLTIFISSLGLTIAGVNLITLAWTAFSRSIELVPLRPLNLGTITFTSIEAILVVVSWLLILALSAIARLQRSRPLDPRRAR